MMTARDIRGIAQVLVDEHGASAPWQAEWRARVAAERGNAESARLWQNIERATRQIVRREIGSQPQPDRRQIGDQIQERGP